ncbi:hypothetical protein [Lentilactobacillus buchneri]|nr:hypothetical protein [Lentilactobacillus buchneri]MCV3742922.1 hypothetical protein [Lentilactobacillus hilgardii]
MMNLLGTRQHQITLKRLLMLAFFSLLVLVPTSASASTNWKHLDMNSLGTATKMKVLKYNSLNWGEYYDDQSDLFKDTKHVQYKYAKRTRTLIMRYRNPQQFLLKTKYNYRKLIYRHGHKNPIVTHYFKVGHEKWKFATTIHYWLKKPIRY